jgi:hypothetical protein
VGVDRPEVVVAVSTLSRSSLERWVNVDCMVEDIFGSVLVVVLQSAVRVSEGSIGSAFYLGTESCLRCRFSIFRVRSTKL